MGTMVFVQMNYSDLLLKTLARIAPGTELREGLERIMRVRTGALIVHRQQLARPCFGAHHRAEQIRQTLTLRSNPATLQASQGLRDTHKYPTLVPPSI